MLGRACPCGQAQLTENARDKVVPSILPLSFSFDRVPDSCASRRGGGAKGRMWWDAGRRTEKQHSFDDFAACADYLSDSGLTSPSRLAIIVRARCWA